MNDLTHAPNHWNSKTRECRAVIETPKGRRSKFDYDPEYGLFTLAGLLAEGLAFPFDFGFIPSTLGQDGDPMDVMVFMDESTYPGCLLDLRIIGVIEAEQTEGKKSFRNDRLFGAAIHSYSHENISSLTQVSKSIVDQIQEFFVSYNKMRGKKFKVLGVHGPKRASDLLEAGIKSFTDKNGK